MSAIPLHIQRRFEQRWLLALSRRSRWSRRRASTWNLQRRQVAGPASQRKTRRNEPAGSRHIAVNRGPYIVGAQCPYCLLSRF